jgi:hypothetical protein
MSQNKHTPGPWRVGNSFMESGVFSADGKTIVALTHGSARYYRRQEQIAEQDANARLIAAAPELLEALVDLTRVMPVLPADAKNIRGIEQQYDAANRAAHAAIAKATGEDQ